MFSKAMKNNRGFSLVELVITMAIGTVSTAALGTFFAFQNQQYSSQILISDMNQNLRGGIELVEKEVRMAGYDPSNAGIIGIPFSVDTLTINADENGDGTIGSGTEMIKYYFDSQSSALIREVNAQPSVVIEHVSDFSITYFDADDAEVTAQIDEGDIRKVHLSISCQAGKKDKSYAQNDGIHSTTLESLILPRNLYL